MSSETQAPARLCVEGLVLTDEHFSGIGQYTHGLLTAIDRSLGSEPASGDGRRVTVLLPSSRRLRLAQLGYRHVRARTLPLGRRWLARLAYRGLFPPVDLFMGRGFYVFPHYTRMPLLASPSAVVVHDLCFLKHPEFLTRRYAAFLRQHVRRSVHAAHTVMTPSETIRREVIEAYGLNPSKVVVASPAVDPDSMHRRSDAEVAWVRERYGIPAGRYLLFLANLEPRKNVTSVLSAYEELPRSVSSRVSLVIVSRDTWLQEQVRDTIARLRREHHRVVLPTREVSDADKPAVISGAAALVYPSHYEGFGIPVLEALACGTPVVASDDAALREVSGGVAVHVPAANIGELTGAMMRCLDDTALQDTARVEGPRRAAAFSWSRTAELYLQTADRATSAGRTAR